MDAKKIGTAAFAASLAYYLYLSVRQAAREMTPRPFSPHGDTRLALVNFSDSDAEQFALILPSWTGAIRTASVTDCVIFPDDTASGPVDEVRSEARQAFWQLQAVEAKRDGGGARPATLAMRTCVEIAGTGDVDVILSPIEIARQCQGLPIAVTTVFGLCTGPTNDDVDIYRVCVEGRVCSPQFLEKLAAARRKAQCTSIVASSEQQNTNNTNLTSDFLQCAAASNFVTLQDLLEPTNRTTLLDDHEVQWQRLFGSLPESAFPDFADESEEADDDGCIDNKKTEPFIRRWRRAKLASARRQQQQQTQLTTSAASALLTSTAMSDLLVEPWKYRGFVQVAYSLMYSQLDRRFGSLFSGFTRGMSQAASSIKRGVTVVSRTGAVSRKTRDASSFLGSILGGGNSNNNDSDDGAPPKRSDNFFTSISNSDFGYASDNPLCGRFEVHVTLRIRDSQAAGDRDVAVLQRFAGAVGMKIVQIELPVGEHPTQLMTSFYVAGTVDACTSAAFDLALQLSMLGLEVLRVKLELQLPEIRPTLLLRNQGMLVKEQLSKDSGANADTTNDTTTTMSAVLRSFFLLDGPGLGLCPVRDFEARDHRHMTPTQYFEFHLKLCLPDSVREQALVAVRRVCGRHDAHLSKNAFKASSNAENVEPSRGASTAPATTAERIWYYFVTLRLYGVGYITSLEKLDALRSDLERALSEGNKNSNNNKDDDDNAINSDSKQQQQQVAHVQSVQREFSIFDSSAVLDRGWIDARVTSTGP